MRVFVTGVNGQLGHDVINELFANGIDCVASDVTPKYTGAEDGYVTSSPYVRLDITNKQAVSNVIREAAPDAVIHCAAWTAVDAAEDEENREKVFSVNAKGTENIALACKETGCKLIYISTDYIFDGGGDQPRKPDDSGYAPLNVYGESKLEGERAVKENVEKFFIVRTAWVFGSNGNNFVKTMLKLSNKYDSIRVVNDQIGTPTYTFDLARLLCRMVISDRYGVYHATNEGGFISWYDFTCEIFRLAGKKTEVVPVTTEEYGLSKAKRPNNSRLDKSKLRENGFGLLPDWRDALKRFLEHEGEISVPDTEDGRLLEALEHTERELTKISGIAANLSSSRSMRALSFFRGLKNCLGGDSESRKRFKARFKAKLLRKPYIYDEKSDPVELLAGPLRKCRNELRKTLYSGKQNYNTPSNYEVNFSNLPKCRILGEKYTKFDVLVFAGDGPEKTNCEKAAEYFKNEGHRVFYPDPGSAENTVIKEGIRDALIISSPEKKGETVYLSENYGFVTAPEPDGSYFFDSKEGAKAYAEAALGLFPPVSIVILCYGQLDYTKKCIRSVLDCTAYPNFEIIAVDNASNDGTAEWLADIAKTEKRLKPVFNKENRGFAGGNNDGIRASSGKYVVLLNNDTLVTRGWLTGLVKHASRDESIGMVGPVTNSIGNEAMINLGYRKNLKKMPERAYDYTVRRMGNEYPHDGILAMFCVLFPKKITEEIGLLDENYGVGMFEDDDYSTAIVKKGYRLVMAEDVFIHHFGSVSFNKLENETYRSLFEKNRRYYENKWNTEWICPHYRPGVFPEN